MFNRYDDNLVDFIVAAVTQIPLHFEMVEEMQQEIYKVTYKFDVYNLKFSDKNEPLFSYKYLEGEDAPFFVGTHWTEGLCPYRQAREVTDDILWIYNSYAMKRFDRYWGDP